MHALGRSSNYLTGKQWRFLVANKRGDAHACGASQRVAQTGQLQWRFVQILLQKVFWSSPVRGRPENDSCQVLDSGSDSLGD